MIAERGPRDDEASELLHSARLARLEPALPVTCAVMYPAHRLLLGMP